MEVSLHFQAPFITFNKLCVVYYGEISVVQQTNSCVAGKHQVTGCVSCLAAHLSIKLSISESGCLGCQSGLISLKEICVTQ